MRLSVAVKKTLVIAILFLTAFSVFSQNTKRGFKLLEKLEYDKAVEQFNGALDENPSNGAAVFGMMLIHADEKSSFFNLVSSWKYGSQMASLTEKLSTEEQEFLGEYFYNTEERHISRPVKKKIEYAVETVEGKLIKYIREENNLELVYEVLKEFPKFRHFDNVIHIRNQLEFRKSEKVNTLETYLEFLKKFPDAAQVDKARKYIHRLAFENALKINTPESYRSYLREYPESEEVNDAVRRLHAVSFESARSRNTIQALEEYMTEFPDALEISEAKLILKQLLYEYARKIQTLEAFNEFIRKYPEGQQYIDIFNLKSLDKGMRYLEANPISDNLQWARSFEEEDNDELSSCIAVDSLNFYITGSTVFRQDTGYTDAWIIKTNSEGKMIWNKYVGEAYNDEIKILTVTTHNEIIGAGYTWSGIDSTSRESWLFKQGSDGRRIWSRKLGKMHITSLLAPKNGLLIAGGYLVNDSLQDLYSVTVLNEQGKRLWARTYTGRGRISDIDETPAGDYILTGSNWYARINPAGYLGSEYMFPKTDSVIACIPMKTTLNFLVLRDSAKLMMLAIDGSGKLLTEKPVALPEIRCQIRSIVEAQPDILIVLLSYADHQSINAIQALTGNVISSARLPMGTLFDSLSIDRQGNLLVGGCNAEIILLKNKGILF